MSTFTPYSETVDTGVEWLGRAPNHWKVLPGMAAMSESKIKNADGKCVDYLSLMAGRGIIPYAEKGDIGNKKPDDLTKCKVVKPGQFVINSMNYYIGSYGVSPLAGICSPVYVVLNHEPELINPKFLNLILSNGSYQTYAQSFGTGILEHRCSIGWDIIRRIPLAIPPLDEQEAIATRVERETARIDALIEKKTRFIELLKEKRQALITQAVTKGLDPKVPMRDSGVEWIGEVPEGWVILKLGFVSRLLGGYAFASGDFTKNDGINIVKMNNLKRGKLDFSDAVTVPDSKTPDTTLLKEGDLVWGMSGSVGETGSLGNYARVTSDDLPCALNQRVGRFAPLSTRVSADYLELIIQSRMFTEQVLLMVTGSAQFNISSSQVESCLVAIPSVNEQRQIVALIQAKCDRLDELMQKSEKSIGLLKERRSALITAAVTGQIDLRAA